MVIDLEAQIQKHPDQERSVVMTTQLLTQHIDSQTREEAFEVTRELQDRHIVGVRLRLDDESEIDLPPHAAELLSFVLQGVTQGDLRIQSIPEELTTRTAAEMLGISRPTLMKMVKEGNVPSHQVGSHHRFFFTDIEELRAQRERSRSEALDELLKIELEQGIES